jgi:hypothetical protein
MKSAVLVVGVLMTSSVAHAEIDPAVVQLWDVVHTADGSVLKGVIVEEVPNTSVRIVIAGGSSIVVQAANIVRFTRELNPGFARVPAATAVTASGTPVRVDSGLRLGLRPSVAVHSEVDDATFMMIASIGYEIGREKWGLIPGVSVLYAADTGNYAYDSVGVHATIRAAYRASTASPFIGFGLGVDVVSEDPSLATFMNAGVELVVHPRFALALEGRLQRGFGGDYTDVHQFAALGMGVEIRF